MTAQELMDQLKDVPPYAVVYMWLDGKRYALQEKNTLDAWDIDEYRVVVDVICKPN